MISLNRQGQWWVLVTVAALLGGFAYIASGHGAGSASDDPGVPEDAASADGESRRAEPSQKPNERSPVKLSPESFQIRVVSASGVGLEGARIVSSRDASEAGKRYALADEIRELGVTGKGGFMSISKKVMLSEDTLFVSVILEGFQVKSLSLNDSHLGMVVDVQLNVAVRLVLECRTREGLPVTGVEVSISPDTLRQGRSESASFMRRLPIGDQDKVIHSARTDVRGVASFAHLAQGRVFIQTYHPQFVLVAGTPNGSGVFDLRSSLDLDLVFDPLVGAIATIVDDDVITWSCSLPKTIGRGSDFTDRLSGMERQWLAKDPGTLCVIAVPEFANGSYQYAGDVVTFDLFTEKRGVTTAQVPIRSMREWSVPHQLVLGKSQLVATASISVCLRTPSGREIEHLAGMRLQPIVSGEPVYLWVSLVSSSPRTIPRGKYRLSTTQPALRRYLNGREIDVAQSGRLVIEVPIEVRLCRLTWENPSGSIVDCGEVSITCGEDIYKIVKTQRLASSLWYLPVGEAMVSIVAPHGRLMDQAVMIASGGTTLEQVVGCVQ